MGHVNEPGRRGRQGASSGAAEASQREQALDDWLDDISDDDWDATAHGIPRAASPVDQGVGVPEGDNWADPSVDRPAPTRFGARDEAHRAVVERRRIVAGLVVVVVVGLGVATSVLLLREGNETPVVTTIEPTTGTTQAPTETSPSTTTTTPSPSPPATTTPATADAFTLPEGTKLQLGENDPTLVRELQQALSSAGYNPGAADGTFGAQTEAAVAAFQEANGLSVDGRVGPETAAALNSALAAD